jgi:hypothetical protein
MDPKATLPRVHRSSRVPLGLAVMTAIACTGRSQLADGGAEAESTAADIGTDTNTGTDPSSESTDGDSLQTDAGTDPTCVPSQPDAPAVSEAQMASSMAAILCIAQVDCDCPGRSHETVPSCRHSLNMTYEDMQLRAQERGLIYDGACLGQLEAAVEALACDIIDPAQSFADVLGAGRCAVYHGDRELGDACVALGNAASDCAQGLACWEGVCVDPCGAVHGDRSNPYGYACPEGQGMAVETGECAVPSALGEPCGPGGCASGGYCASVCKGDVCGGQCAPATALGDACEDDTCGEHVCDSGLCVVAPTLPSICFAP